MMKYFANDNKYREITRKIISGLTYTNMVHKVSQEKINKLYETHNLSVSKLEKYSACPFAYFIQYGPTITGPIISRIFIAPPINQKERPLCLIQNGPLFLALAKNTFFIKWFNIIHDC